jgi:hypothetical protein
MRNPIPGHRQEVGAPLPSHGRARALLDRVGSCRAPGVDPGAWAVVVPARSLSQRTAARVRARVLCAGCPVPGLCRRTVLAVLAAPGRSLGESREVAAGQGVWGGLAWWEVRVLIRRSRKASAAGALTRVGRDVNRPSRAAGTSRGSAVTAA